MMKNKLSSYLRKPWVIISIILLVNAIARGIISIKDISTQNGLDDTQKMLYMGSYGQALDTINNLIKSDPENPELLAKKCTILNKLGDLPATTTCLEGLGKLSRNPVYIQLYKTILAIQNNDYEGAKIYLDSMMTGDTTTDELINMRAGIRAYGSKDSTGAASYLDSAIASDANNPYALYYRGLVAQLTQDRKESLKYFDRAEKNGIVEPMFLYAKGLSLNKTYKYPEAIGYFDTILKIQDTNTGALFQKGYALSRMENYADALTTYDKGLSIEPQNKDILYEKGNTFFKLGDYKNAIGLYDQSLEVLSGAKNINAYGQKMLSYYMLGNTSGVNTMRAEIDTLITTHGWGNVMMGRIFSQMKKFDQVAPYFDRAITIDPTYKLIYDDQVNNLIRQAIELDRNSKYIESDALLDQAFSVHNGEYSDNSNIIFFKGLTTLLNGGRNYAADHFQKLWKSGYKEEDLDVVTILRNIWESNYDLAEKQIYELAEKYPKSLAPFHLKVFSLTQIKKNNKLISSPIVTKDKKTYDDPDIQSAMKEGLKKYNEFFRRYWEL